jgi:sporulation integral membrane protein YlbJ
MLIFPEASISGASFAIDSWIFIVLPALLPFSIVASILVLTGAMQKIAMLFEPITKKVFGFSGFMTCAFLTSAFSGYPVGARVTADLYKQGGISQKEAALMLNATSTSGPLFISGAVAVGMLYNAELSPYLLISHYISAIIIAFLNGFILRRSKDKSAFISSKIKEIPLPKAGMGAILLNSVLNSVNAMLIIGGFMVLFSSMTSIIETTPLFSVLPSRLYDFSNALISGILEMTSGCINASFLPIDHALLLISFFIGFGSFSVICQTDAIASSAGIKQKGLVLSKLAQGIISMLITLLILKLFPLHLQISLEDMPFVTVFANTAPQNILSANTYVFVATLLVALTAFILIFRGKKRR